VVEGGLTENLNNWGRCNWSW